MKRFLFVVAVSVALTLAAAPSAGAQPAVTCASSSADVVKQTDFLAGRAEALVALQPGLETAGAAVAVDAEALSKAAAELAASEGTAAAVAAAEVKLLASVDALQAAVVAGAEVEAEISALVSAEEALRRSVGVRVLACATAVPTTSAASTTSPAAVPAPFENCAAVEAAGAAPIASTDPRFQASLDGDGDGVGCDESAAPVIVVPNDAPETGDGSSEPIPFGVRLALVLFVLNVGALLARYLPWSVLPR